MTKNNQNAEVTVFLAPIEAKRFLEFQRHYEIFNLLIEKKVFEQKAAAITLHFDNQGFLRAVTRADALYSSDSNFTNTN